MAFYKFREADIAMVKIIHVMSYAYALLKVHYFVFLACFLTTVQINIQVSNKRIKYLNQYTHRKLGLDKLVITNVQLIRNNTYNETTRQNNKSFHR